MNINFPPADQAFIKAQVANGYYTNATEVVRDLVRREREKQSGQGRARILAAIQKGIDDVEAGRVVPYDKNFWKNIDKQVRKRLAKGPPYNFDPDVVGPEGQEPWA